MFLSLDQFDCASRSRSRNGLNTGMILSKNKIHRVWNKLFMSQTTENAKTIRNERRNIFWKCLRNVSESHKDAFAGSG